MQQKANSHGCRAHRAADFGVGHPPLHLQQQCCPPTPWDRLQRGNNLSQLRTGNSCVFRGPEFA
jgi:hypothetical protein